MCPENMLMKKPANMTNVHTVLVMKVAFFFSYSDGSTGFSFGRMFTLSLVGLVGSDSPVEELGRRLSWPFARC